MIGADDSMTSRQNRGGALSSWARKRAARVMLPAILLVAFIAEFFTREGPDYTLHSWVGIALILIIAVHLTGNAAWIRGVWKRRRQHREFGLGVLNATFGALVGTCIITGFHRQLHGFEVDVVGAMTRGAQHQLVEVGSLAALQLPGGDPGQEPGPVDDLDRYAPTVAWWIELDLDRGPIQEMTRSDHASSR